MYVTPSYLSTARILVAYATIFLYWDVAEETGRVFHFISFHWWVCLR